MSSRIEFKSGDEAVVHPYDYANGVMLLFVIGETKHPQRLCTHVTPDEARKLAALLTAEADKVRPITP